MNRDKIIKLYGKRAVIDNNIISDLCELGCLDLLNRVFSIVMIPQSILDDEVKEHKEEIKKIIFTPVSIEKFETYQFLYDIKESHGRLSDYDAELVSIAYENCVLCTSNEKRIMTTCEENKIEYTGTLGVLCLAYEKGFITKEGLSEYVYRLRDECSCYLSNGIVSRVFNTYEICS